MVTTLGTNLDDLWVLEKDPQRFYLVRVMSQHVGQGLFLENWLIATELPPYDCLYKEWIPIGSSQLMKHTVDEQRI